MVMSGVNSVGALAPSTQMWLFFKDRTRQKQSLLLNGKEVCEHVQGTCRSRDEQVRSSSNWFSHFWGHLDPRGNEGRWGIGTCSLMISCTSLSTLPKSPQPAVSVWHTCPTRLPPLFLSCTLTVTFLPSFLSFYLVGGTKDSKTKVAVAGATNVQLNLYFVKSGFYLIPQSPEAQSRNL